MSSLEDAYAAISALPTILNVTGTATPVAVPDSAKLGGPNGGRRRVRIANVGSALGGIVWATRVNPDANKIIGQTIADATQLSPGTAETFLVDATMSIGYVGTTDFSITISDR